MERDVNPARNPPEEAGTCDSPVKGPVLLEPADRSYVLAALGGRPRLVPVSLTADGEEVLAGEDLGLDCLLSWRLGGQAVLYRTAKS